MCACLRYVRAIICVYECLHTYASTLMCMDVSTCMSTYVSTCMCVCTYECVRGAQHTGGIGLITQQTVYSYDPLNRQESTFHCIKSVILTAS